MSALAIVAPTDAQLLYIDSLCGDRGLSKPEVVASKQEAAAIIDALKAGCYDPDAYRYDEAPPGREAMSLGGARPDPKAKARGPRRYRRKVASPKQWQAIQAAKLGPCRVCGSQARNGRVYGLIHLHHLVTRADFGDDVAANIVSVCPDCHDLITRRDPTACRALLSTLTDDEYAYVVQRAGEDYFELAYSLAYLREGRA